MRYIYLSVFLILFVVGISRGQDNGRRLRICEYAISQIGVTEKTGNNDGEVEKYLRYVGLSKGNPYCSAFLCYVYAQDCAPNPRNGYSPAWFPQKKIVYDRNSKENKVVQAGDVFGIYFASKGRIAHVGLIIDMGSQWVTSVEANTSEDVNEGEATREGQGVYKKKRLKKQVYQVSNWID